MMSKQADVAELHHYNEIDSLYIIRGWCQYMHCMLVTLELQTYTAFLTLVHV
jgi:hypothetical protein